MLKFLHSIDEKAHTLGFLTTDGDFTGEHGQHPLTVLCIHHYLGLQEQPGIPQTVVGHNRIIPISLNAENCHLDDPLLGKNKCRFSCFSWLAFLLEGLHVQAHRRRSIRRLQGKQSPILHSNCNTKRRQPRSNSLFVREYEAKRHEILSRSRLASGLFFFWLHSPLRGKTL